MNSPNVLVVLPRLRVQNANAISGPLSWGFPAVTAFTGFMHAMQRKLAAERPLEFLGVGIVCHDFSPQVTRPSGKYTQVFNLTRNPLTKDGATAALVEEGRAHFEVSLVIAARGRIDSDESADVAEQIMQTVQTLRLAGGTVLPQRIGKRYQAAVHLLSSSEQEVDALFQGIKRRLLPGFALIHREDRLAEHLTVMQQKNPHATSLDALLDLTRLNIAPQHSNPDKPDEMKWEINKPRGWVVPIPIGYAALSPLYAPGKVQNARDETTPFRFVECLYSLGEWISPHRLTSLQQILWRTHADVNQGLYLSENRFSNIQPDTTR